ncbi:MAG: stalk domain-containing protein [Tissierellia bacterium]|nr:stalk domain-containing protein [Tissierellia bacterium]MDD4725502.1 stalk domain-containing protein [Tissierellia bacterium]
MKRLKKMMFLCMAGTLLFIGSPHRVVLAVEPIKLVVNGNDITSMSSPVLENNRTLVPIRFISEELGAEVSWDDINRTVLVEKGNDTVLLRIGSQLVSYDNGLDYEISDVTAKIINDRTYVPLRLISNALDIGIDWDDTTRTVIVDSKLQSEDTSFFDIKLLSHENGATINGKTNLQLGSSAEYLGNGNEIRFLLLDPSTAKGFIIERGNDINGSYSYMPTLDDNGQKVLIGAIYDKDGNFIGGDSVAVNVNIDPRINLAGIYNGQVLSGSTDIKVDINFFPTYIKYEITNLDTGNTTLSAIQDPLGSFAWATQVKDNGNYSIRAIAYDGDTPIIYSEPINVQTAVERTLSLNGVKDGATVSNAVTLMANRNFDVTETQYIMKDVNTEEVKVLSTIPYGSYTWHPSPEDSGLKDIIVRVKAGGNVYDSLPIRVNVDGSPKLLIEGIGPKQVLTNSANIKASSNVNIDSISYTLKNSKTGERKMLASNLTLPADLAFSPTNYNGEWTLQAEGLYNGKKIVSEEIPFRVYLGQIHGPQPIVEKSLYLDFASNLAKNSFNQTGMSAALQTAQSILETGWGQSGPVDKYTGLKSNNLFGIKGVGPAGSVTSTTWEVYNGVRYTVDADFRAYDSPQQSWADHKEFLERDRYAGLRDVMYDYSQGAWALKRAGYATDPEYALKLMNLINQYNLDELDKVGI